VIDLSSRSPASIDQSDDSKQDSVGLPVSTTLTANTKNTTAEVRQRNGAVDIVARNDADGVLQTERKTSYLKRAIKVSTGKENVQRRWKVQSTVHTPVSRSEVRNSPTINCTYFSSLFLAKDILASESHLAPLILCLLQEALTPTTAHGDKTGQAGHRLNGHDTDQRQHSATGPREGTPAYSPMEISPAVVPTPRQPKRTASSEDPAKKTSSSGAEAGSALEGVGSQHTPGTVGGNASSAANMAALELLADCAAAEAVAAKNIEGDNVLQVELRTKHIYHLVDRRWLTSSLHSNLPAKHSASAFTLRWKSLYELPVMNAWQVRNLLRKNVREAAVTVTKKASETGKASLHGSTLLWSLLRQCLKQQGGALIELEACKDAAKGAYAEVL
jgi:hypothetical protein